MLLSKVISRSSDRDEKLRLKAAFRRAQEGVRISRWLSVSPKDVDFQSRFN